MYGGGFAWIVAYSRVSCFEVSIRLERVGRGDADTLVGCSSCHDLISQIARRKVYFLACLDIRHCL